MVFYFNRANVMVVLIVFLYFLLTYLWVVVRVNYDFKLQTRQESPSK